MGATPLLAAALMTVAHAAGTSLPPPNYTAIPVVDLDHVPETASVRPENQPGKPHQVHARLLFDREAVKPGETIRVGLHLTQDENWHTYWKSPGDIGLPTEVAWASPPGVRVMPFEFPVPHRFELQGIVSYGYEDQVLLYTEMTFPADQPAGTVEIGAEASWLVCEVSCIPGKTSLTRTLEVVTDGEPGPSPAAPLFDHAQALHPTPAADSPGAVFSGALDGKAVAPEKPFTVTFLLKPKPGAEIAVEKDANGWPFFAPIIGDQWMVLDTAITEDAGVFKVVISGETFAPETLPTDDRVGGLFQYKVGDTWIRNEFTIPLPWSDPSVAQATTASAQPAELISPAPVAHSLPAMLLFAFLGGILLNIMPCVLPVLFIKIGNLLEQADADARERHIAGLGYTVGVVGSFLALGGVVIVLRSVMGVEVGWGYQFQVPAYVIALATIVFVFGLSLFGVFQVPTFGANQMNRAQRKEGVLGHVLTGAFATLLATPCSAPFLGTGMGFAFTLPAMGILGFFAMAGLGLALPFLLIAFIPAFVRFMPERGDWMEDFSKLMGFTLMATTVWLVDVLAAQTGSDGAVGFLAFLMLVSMACWIVGRWGGPIASNRSKAVSLLVALTLSVLAGRQFLVFDFAEPEVVDTGTIVTDLDFSEEIPWQPFTEDRVERLAGTTVFVDFTADWCLTCKVNEKTVLETETVRKSMADHGVVPLKADWTRRDPVITRWLQRFGKAGVPIYLVIPGDRSQETILLPEVITPGVVTDAIERAS